MGFTRRYGVYDTTRDRKTRDSIPRRITRKCYSVTLVVAFSFTGLIDIMDTNMHLTLFMAMSANGLIADSRGSEDFLSDEHWNRFISLAKEHGNIIVGRKTYEAVKAWNNGLGFNDLGDITKIVVSRDASYSTDAGYICASSPQEALAALAHSGTENALLTGGANLNSQFAKAGLIDEIILSVEPVFLGEGKSLFAADDFEMRTSVQSVSQNGQLVEIRYQVTK